MCRQEAEAAVAAKEQADASATRAASGAAQALHLQQSAEAECIRLRHAPMSQAILVQTYAWQLAITVTWHATPAHVGLHKC